MWKDVLTDMILSGILIADKRQETLNRLRIKGPLFCLSKKYIVI